MGERKRVKVLVVDDTCHCRQIVCDILAGFPLVQVVGTAANGKEALERIAALQPELLILDDEMPVMGGLQLLQAIQEQKVPVACIMFSAKTVRGSETTVRALELGAFDFVTKPENLSLAQSLSHIRSAMASALLSYQHRKRNRGATPIKKQRCGSVVRTAIAPPKRSIRSQVVAIGVSTGGPEALMEVIPRLPANIGVPILLVQHMPALFTKTFAQSLNRRSPLMVKEAANGETLVANTVYLAPGNLQMMVVKGAAGGRTIRLTDDPPEHSCRPAVDYLFRSVADAYGEKTTCVIMTGMGNDGRDGVRRLREKGAFCIAQSEESSVVYGMPRAVIEANLVDVIAPLHALAEEILKTV